MQCWLNLAGLYCAVQIFSEKIGACALLPGFCERKWEDLRLRASLNRGAHNERPPKLLFSGFVFRYPLHGLCVRPSKKHQQAKREVFFQSLPA